MQSLQDKYAPKNMCFGCGPANDKGLQIKSYVDGDFLTATFLPQSHHQAFGNVLNGGICGALLDCHSNWAAAHHFMKKAGQNSPPCTVTAEFLVKLKHPTPMDAPINLRAHVEESAPTKAIVEAELISKEVVCATCRGVFVAVKEGHPAYHRW